MIVINLLRINPTDGTLDINVETDSNYKFKNLYIWTSYDDTTWNPDEDTIDLGDQLAKESNVEIVNISMSSVTANPLYYIQFVIEWDGTGVEDTEMVLSSNASIVNLADSYSKKVELVKDLYNPLYSNQTLLRDIYITEDLLQTALSLERFEDANFYVNQLISILRK